MFKALREQLQNEHKIELANVKLTQSKKKKNSTSTKIDLLVVIYLAIDLIIVSRTLRYK